MERMSLASEHTESERIIEQYAALLVQHLDTYARQVDHSRS
jgi:hypothetical protein